jgi:uncharacterized membrane protein YdbT with pleckstrin-like domain
MSYVDKSLITNESVVFRTRLHWIIFTWPILFLIASCVLFYFGFFSTHPGFMYAAEILLVITFIVFIAKYIVYRSSEFAVTNKRVIIKIGVMQQRTLELLLTKVEAISVTQSLLGQMFGCGSIMVTGTGGTREAFNNISSPLQFRRAVQAASSGETVA